MIESANFPISDCQGWKRLESTHIDHVAEAFGHLTIFTEDISAIQTVPEADESFKTALEVQDNQEAELVEHMILAEDSSNDPKFVRSTSNPQ